MEIREESDSILIVNAKEEIGLYLSADKEYVGLDRGVYFISDKYQFWRFIGGELDLHSIRITARDINDYPKEVSKILGRDVQYLEVGAGLGEPVCYFAKQAKEQGFKRPIVIDPANYSLLEKMLVFALNKAQQKAKSKLSKEVIESHKPRMTDLISRCKTMMDSEAVYLVNTTLEEAYKLRELRGIADYVVDFWGVKTNSGDSDENQAFIDGAELSFLRPNGRLIQSKNSMVKVFNKSGELLKKYQNEGLLLRKSHGSGNGA